MRLTLVTCAFLFGITAALFWPASDNGFVNWDDNVYVCEEAKILEGIRWKGLVWAATTNVANNWHPLTLMSLQLDAQLFGPGPTGFHRTSVLIHSLNAALLYLALLALTGCQWRSATVAILFAIHPMRVESVAWVSERKDVLSGCFFFLTLLTYARYVATPSWRRYSLVAICLGLGLSAKSMLVTTPCVLYLLDFWPLGRVKTAGAGQATTFKRLAFEKVPLLGLSVAISVITVIFQQTAIKSLTRFTLPERIQNAAIATAVYIGQTFIPYGLSPFYIIHHLSLLYYFAALGLIIGVTVVAARQRILRPYVLIGWLWFLGMLFPVAGLIQVGNQARADRYMYLPQIGLFIAVVWTVFDLVRHSRRGKIAAISLTIAYLIGLAFVTIKQIPVWSDTESLWRRAYQFEPQNGSVIDFLITAVINAGKKDEAIQLTNEALRTCDETDIDKMRMLAIFLTDLGQHEECIQALDKSLKHYPDDTDLIARRGKARAALGLWEQAADDFRKASRLAPHQVTYEFFLAHAMNKAGMQDQALQTYRAALRQSPHWPDEAAWHAWQMSTNYKTRQRREGFWAVCLAEQANEASHSHSARILDILAAAYAHAGRFDDAKTTEQLAIQRADAAHQHELASAARERLQLYEKDLPYRQPPPNALVNPVE